ncbi:hypothetical protein [Arcicella rosea]|uniref:Uncharacterized protein n=1 Tax=Arcicella rosea TaxID=502909 RepID=A0A841EWQ1_9BACT|nr:hypothetical protein [Arcicella rosea]MBB6003891.1 hypothetical protein [Arcicella rosea]
MKVLEITSELILQNTLRCQAGLSDTLPEWALHKISYFLHQKWLLEHPEFTFTCKKTNETVNVNHPDFDFVISSSGSTVKYFLCVKDESSKSFIHLDLSLDCTPETLFAILC